MMMNDAWSASVRSMPVRDCMPTSSSPEPGVVVPANVAASIGQTSLLGLMHPAINPSARERRGGRSPPGSTIPLNNASTYLTTEQTLSPLATVVNGGGSRPGRRDHPQLQRRPNGRDTDFRTCSPG